MKALLLKAVEALTKLSSYASGQTCAHDDTYRGGAIWEICRNCGAKWADDEGGRPPYVEPRELIAASATIADLEAAIREQPGEASGWRLVPLEPTVEMLLAYSAGTMDNLMQTMTADNPGDVDPVAPYRAMLAVAPLKDEGEARANVRQVTRQMTAASLVNELVEQGKFFERGEISEAEFIATVNHYVNQFAALSGKAQP